MMKIWNIFSFFILLLIFHGCNSQVPFSDVNFKDDITKTIDIHVKYEEFGYIYIGLEKTIYLETDFNDTETNYFNSSDIEEKTSFNTYIIFYFMTSVTYKTTCRLWKPKNDTLKLICKIASNFNRSMETILQSSVCYYNTYKINIYAPSKPYFTLLIPRIPVPFLYADEQCIKIEEEKESYELKFNYVEYNNESLYLYSNNAYLYLNNCSKKEKNLICHVEKEDIEEIMHYNIQKFDVYYSTEGYGFKRRAIIYNITIIDEINEKKDIYVGITKLLQEYIDYNSFIAYETNVTNISKMVSGRFPILRDSKILNCFFKKSGDAPMLFLCNWVFSNLDNILGNLTIENIITNCSFKYNFRIQPVYNNENFKIVNRGYYALYAHPYTKVFNFSSDKTFAIGYIRSYDDPLSVSRELRLSPDLDDLDCTFIYKDYICYVNRSYFENKKSGYYYSYHLINYYDYDIYSIYYEFSPIQVIIPDDNRIYIKIKKQENNITLGQKGTLFLKTSYNDNETNIFNETDIEDVEFKAKFNDINATYYDANCRLLKSANNNISLICNLNQNLIYEKQQIILKEAKFNYKNYTIIIFSNEYTFVEQVNYTIPLLYSDNQTIIINEQNDEYYLIFKIGQYNNEVLFLNGISNNYAKLESCNIDKRKLNCKISKKKLEEILTINNEQFKVKAINDEIGIIQLDFVGSITLNYNITNKEDIYVGINKILNNMTEEGIPIAFETNVSSISNLKTYKFNDIGGYCYFNKIQINPLLLLCIYQAGYTSNKKSLKNEMVLDNIHYKFNFRIQPYSIETRINVVDYGTGIYSADIDELNFVSQNTTTIRFILGNSFYVKNIAMVFSNSNSSENYNNINCLHLKEMLKCDISISYFINKNNIKEGLIQIYRSYQSSNLKLDYGIFPIKVILPDNIVGIYINNKENDELKIICQNARIYLLTDYNSDDIFNSDTIEEETHFNTTIKTTEKNNSIIYDINCNFWKPKNSNIIIICRFDNDINFNEVSEFQGYFNEVIFYYKVYRIIITPNILLNFQTRNQICPFLYAEEQLINVEENDDIYELNFKIDNYNNESLFLSNIEINYIKINCSEKNNNLLCKLEKEKLLEQNIDKIFKVYYRDEKYGFPELGLILGVRINSNIEKENIYVNISSLLQKNIEYNNYIAYESNVTNISNLITNNFLLNTNKTFNCFFKKSELNNLLILCNLNKTGNYSLGEIKTQIILDDIHIKYNFIILPVKSNEIFNIEGIGSKALFIYPQFIDLYLNDFSTIDIILNSIENIKSILLNSFSLDCNNSYYLSSPNFKRCIIRKEYFKNIYSTQYFYLQYLNINNSSSIFYELSPIQIKLQEYNEIFLRINKEYNNNLLKIGKNGTLFLITDYFDLEDRLDSDDIENKTIFITKIIDESENEYNAICKLWKESNNKTIYIICNLNETLKYSKQKIKLNDIMFEYKNFSIKIISNTYIEVNQVNYSLSFLYSNKQYIHNDYSDYKDSHNLNFIIESYNNDILFLYSTNDNYIILDNCIENINRTLSCKILTSKIEEIIIENIEYLYVGAMNDNIGVYRFKSIFPIEIKTHFPKKLDIYVSLISPLSKIGEVGTPFGFITNVTVLSNLITKKFNNYCYFQKLPELSLYYFCIVDREQTYFVQINKTRIHLNDIHWKYNFIIEPIYSQFYFDISGNSSDIKLSYPEKIDFLNDDNFIIKLIMPKPYLSNKIKLNRDLPILDCQDLDEMKICKGFYAYFRGKLSGNYYLYHSGKYESFLYGCSPIYVNLSSIIELSIDEPNMQYLGKNNILFFTTNYLDKSNVFNNSELSEISLNLTFSNNDNKTLNVICNLWKPIDEKIRLICKFNERFENEEQLIYLNEKRYNYKNYKFIFYNSTKYLTIKQFYSQIAFLYYDEQIININDNIDSYILKFKKEFYNNEQLILYQDINKRAILDCKDELGEIKCLIEKDDLFQILSEPNEKFFISQMVDNLGIMPIYSILDIKFNYTYINKTQLNIEKLKLLTSIVEKNCLIVYDTNIIIREKLTTNFFNIIKISHNITKCQLKTNQERLLLLCLLATTSGENSIGNITETILFNSSVLYNFKIFANRNLERYTVTKNEGAIIYSVYPKEIDFNEQDSFIIRYETNYPKRLNGIKLNNDSSFELECVNRIGLKECRINQTHFTESGEYYTYYTNSLGYKSISYEADSIKVILKDDSEPETDEESENENEKEEDTNDEYEEESEIKPTPSDNKEENKLSETTLIGIIVGSVIGGLIIIGLIIFLVLRWKKKKSEDALLIKENNASNKIELVENFDN